MILLGVLAIILGFVLGIPILITLGIVLVVVGLVLEVLHRTGRSGRRYY